jgi:hypothetical protein
MNSENRTPTGLKVVVCLCLVASMGVWVTSRIMAIRTVPLTEFHNDVNAAQKAEVKSYHKALEAQGEIQKRTDEGATAWQK